MTGPEAAFEDLILTHIPSDRINELDFDSLPEEVSGILGLTHPNPKARIRYLARNYLEELTITGKFSWIGIVRTEINNKSAITIFPNSHPTIKIDRDERKNIRDALKLLATVTDPIIIIGMAYMSSPVGTERGAFVTRKILSDFGVAELVWETDI